MERQNRFKKVKRVVVKLGTAVLTHDNLELNLARIRSVVNQIAELKKRGLDVLVVTSGAIGVGAHALGYRERPTDLAAKQASAAVGQGRLMHVYERLFAKHGLLTAQILLTKADLEDRGRYVNAKNTLNELLRLNTIPIINENDTVAVDEIKFGDNDTLAAYSTNLIGADLLVLLSDIEGLMDQDPRKAGAAAQTIPEVTKIDRDIEMIAEGARAYRGVGGIKTKLDAAKIVVLSGEIMVLADGKRPRILLDILDGKHVGTIFYPHGQKISHKKRWLMFLGSPTGTIEVDDGAKNALKDHCGRSLLASGISAVKMDFKKEDIVEIADKEGRVIGRGRVNYSSQQLERIRGKKSDEICRILGISSAMEVVHRDEMVIF